MVEARKALLVRLFRPEREYLVEFYQPKESQFTRAYTRTYLNLGVHSTQRNKSYHVVVKKKLNRNLTLSDAIKVLVT